MNLVDVSQFDTHTFNGIKAKLSAGILNARIVADDESFPKSWRELAQKTLELARSYALTAAEPFRYQGGRVLTVVDGKVAYVEFDNGEYRVRVQ